MSRELHGQGRQQLPPPSCVNRVPAAASGHDEGCDGGQRERRGDARTRPALEARPCARELLAAEEALADERDEVLAVCVLDDRAGLEPGGDPQTGGAPGEKSVADEDVAVEGPDRLPERTAEGCVRGRRDPPRAGREPGEQPCELAEVRATRKVVLAPPERHRADDELVPVVVGRDEVTNPAGPRTTVRVGEDENLAAGEVDSAVAGGVRQEPP
jgi:hypothetical protein